jgi:hypothetical protein
MSQGKRQGEVTSGGLTIVLLILTAVFVTVFDWGLEWLGCGAGP